MGKWLDQLRDAMTGPVGRPSHTGMADALTAAAPPELQNSHGGSFMSSMIGGMGDALRGVGGLVDYTGQVARGQGPDPRSDEGIDRVAKGAWDLAQVATALPGEAGALGIFAGRNAKTADQVKLSLAQDLHNGGFTPREIWDKTGWFQGADGRWRFEIDDSASRIGQKAQDELLGNGTYGATQRTAPGVLQHGDLYAAYPDARAIDVDARYNAGLRQMSGQYQESGPGGRPQIGMSLNAIEGPQGPRSVMLHELQHDLQGRENFARGGSPEGMVDMANQLADPIAREAGRLIQAGKMTEDQALDWMMAQNEGNYAGQLYNRLAGEVEARNVQTRRDFTPEQRRAQAPWETEDTPRERQIVSFR